MRVSAVSESMALVVIARTCESSCLLRSGAGRVDIHGPPMVMAYAFPTPPDQPRPGRPTMGLRSLNSMVHGHGE